ncbi:MAG TPA: hypothetical protein VFW44_16520 [Bryobacteraceae bacterium]|nr:hypothetical protein [Bryobacteraceae bacterium]
MRFFGFEASDLVEFVIALVFVALAARRWIEAFGQRLAISTGSSMALLLVLPIILRVALLPQYPIPIPNVSDDFSYLLLADTLRHFRLANPVHPLHPFFETFFVLQQPSYASIFPPGQGLVLILGWAGVALSIGGLCALCYWMLRAWITPGWALLGGLLSVMEFGPLNQWMNSFWGGAVEACAGCLVFGALPRLRSGGRPVNAALVGLGIGISWLCRPYETVFLILSALVFVLPSWRSLKWAAVVFLPVLGLSLAHNKAVTGSWTTLPYQLSQYQYGVPTSFTFQQAPEPHRALTREQQLDYEQQSQVHNNAGDYWARWAGRLRFYRFFFLAPLYLAIPVFFLRMGERRFAWVLLTILIFSYGTNFYPYFYSHYIAALTCLFVLIAVIGLECLSRWNELAAQVVLLLCFAHFVFWYGIHASRDVELDAGLSRFETWDAINHGDPLGRIAIHRQLAATPGRQLVFVRYRPQHAFDEWVHNAADIDAASVVWARDLGTAENQKLLHYYPDRNAWLLEPDARPIRLQPYPR